MIESQDISGYAYADAAPGHAHAYLLPAVMEVLETEERGEGRIFDLGCGNGSTAAFLSQRGYQVVGVDPSTEGIEQAHRHYPELDLFQGSAYDDLAEQYGRFPLVISLEVIEHVYDPRSFALCIYDLLTPNGTAIISTPYHGYWKNLVLALAGKMDNHFTALWDHGHIKLWSMKTLGTLLRETGFQDISFRRVGRIPPLAKSMIAVARK